MKINNVNVVNASKPMKIEITAKDVKDGNKKDSGSCAAAQACLRLKQVTDARVHLGRTYLKIGDKWLRFNTPKALRTEIVSFDRANIFDPGEYILAPCSPAKRKNKQQGTKTNQQNKTSKKKRAKPHYVTGVRAHGANR